MAIDSSNNLFIADTQNNRIRKVSPNGIITTVAGNGMKGDFGDGGTATNASLNLPHAVRVDSLRNLFIVEKNHNRIRKVSSSGIITTVAGNGLAGYFGDGGAATNASLYYPNSIGIDHSGNLFVVDCYNNRIRKITIIQRPVSQTNTVRMPDAANYQVVMTSQRQQCVRIDGPRLGRDERALYLPNRSQFQQERDALYPKPAQLD